MRSEVKKLYVEMVIRVNYQFDDHKVLDGEIHHFEWRGLIGSGKTKEQAIENLEDQLNI